MQMNKLIRRFVGTGSTAALCLQINSEAQALEPWQPADDYQPGDKLSATAADIGIDSNGRIVSVGSVVDASGTRSACVRASGDSGANSDSLGAPFAPDGFPWAHYRAFAAVSDGTSHGILFAGGELWDGRPTIGTKNWIVQRSLDGGATWSVSDQVDQGDGAKVSCADLKISPTGDIYAAGYLDGVVGGPILWSVRKSSDGGSTWETIDSAGTIGASQARAIGFSPAGVFVVGGVADQQSSLSTWTVRRSADSGKTWVTVESFHSSRNQPSLAQDIAVDRVGRLYVAGYARGFKGYSATCYWVVRRSTNGGASWGIVENLSMTDGQFLSPTGMIIAPSGAIYVVGHIGPENESSPNRWFVRRGTPGSKGISWTTSDDFHYSPGMSAQAWDTTCDAFGNVFVAGRGQDADGVTHWLVRKLAL